MRHEGGTGNDGGNDGCRNPRRIERAWGDGSDVEMSSNARSIERAHLKRARVLEVARAVQGGAVGRRRAAVAAGIEKTRAEALVHGVENEPARTLNGVCA